MMDFFLKYTNRVEAVSALSAMGIREQFDADKKPTNFWQTENYAVEMVGEMGKAPVVEFDPLTGEEVIVEPALPPNGYLVNVRWMDDTTVPVMDEIRPRHPKRIFAHDDN